MTSIIVCDFATVVFCWRNLPTRESNQLVRLSNTVLYFGLPTEATFLAISIKR